MVRRRQQRRHGVSDGCVRRGHPAALVRVGIQWRSVSLGELRTESAARLCGSPSHRKGQDMRILRHSAILVAFLLLLPTKSVQTQIPDPFGGAFIGVGLGRLAEAIQRAVEMAIAGGQILEVQAGGQISVLLQQAQATFQQQADLTWQQINAQEQQILGSTASLADEFLKRTYKSLDELMARVQVTMHTLPFAGTFPQVYRSEPTWTPQRPGHPIRVKFAGDFVDVLRESLTRRCASERRKSRALRRPAKLSGSILMKPIFKQNPTELRQIH